MSRTLPYLAELQPEMFCEVGPALAAERGLEHGGWATIVTSRTAIEARVLVTDRIPPLRVGGRTVHQVGLPYHWGAARHLHRRHARTTCSRLALDPNVHIQEVKAATCDVRRAAGRAGRARGAGVPRARLRAEHGGRLRHEPRRVGFFTDTSVCIGCKACEVACKEWNGVPDDPLGFTGESYDNSGALGANRWRHVAFIEQERGRGTTDIRWLMSSDVCKHCTEAACLDACPTGALFRTEFGTVVVQEDVCNGCGYCVVACPFGVIDQRERRRARLEVHALLRPAEGRRGARLREGVPHRLDPVRPAGRAARAAPRCACASCTARGEDRARLYGADPGDGVGGAGAFFLLLDEPEVYGLPPDPVVADPAARRASGRRPASRRARWPPASRRRLPEGGGERDAGDCAWCQRAEPRSYYGRPVVKPPVWKPQVPWYFFTGGLTGGAATFALAAEWRGRRAARAGARAWSRCSPGRRAPCC